MPGEADAREASLEEERAQEDAATVGAGTATGHNIRAGIWLLVMLFFVSPVKAGVLSQILQSMLTSIIITDYHISP